MKRTITLLILSKANLFLELQLPVATTLSGSPGLLVAGDLGGLSTSLFQVLGSPALSSLLRVVALFSNRPASTSIHQSYYRTFGMGYFLELRSSVHGYDIYKSSLELTGALR